jgi:large repetitive protein
MRFSPSARFGATVLALVMVATAFAVLSAGTASATVTPGITVTPSFGPDGATYSVGGSGFTPNAGATVTFAGSLQTPSACSTGTFSGSTITTDSVGIFVCSFAVPAGTPEGTVFIVGTDLTSGNTATVSFLVTTPTLTLTPDQGPAGATYTVGGSGFSASSGAQVSWNMGVGVQTPSACSEGSFSGSTITTDENGIFVCTFTVPSVAETTYGVTGTDLATGDTSASVPFTVTTPALVLTPTQGLTGVTVTASGSGFTPSVSITFTISAGGTIGSPSACSTADSGPTEGGFSGCTFTVSGPETTYTITATGSDGAFDSATASFEITTPALVLSPTQGPSGVTITASGTGFTPSVSITFSSSGGGTIGSPSACSTADSGATEGDFSGCTFTLTASPEGPYTITATGSDGGADAASANFKVTSPELTLTPDRGPSGVGVTASGGGFTPGVSLSFTISGSASVVLTGSCTVGSNGRFGGCALTVTGSPTGPYTITATGSDGAFDSSSEVFTITSPELTLTPSRGPSGVSVTGSGGGFTPGVSITFSGPYFGMIGSPSACTVGTNGRFGGCTFTVSFDVEGTYAITATGSDGAFDSSHVNFVITSPELSLSPARGPSGVTVTASGGGFTPGVTLSFTMNNSGSATLTGTCTVGSNGRFGGCTLIVTAPLRGPYAITAVGSDGSFDASSASFQVTTPTLTLSPERGPSGTTVTASGSGFTPGVTISFSISAGGSLGSVSTCTVSSTGTISGCTFTVSGSVATTYTITATGSDGSFDSASASYRVT